jgi:outer membrane receptor protein involved in Fe transport
VEVELFGVAPARSDSLGRYRVGGLAPGAYLMRVRRLGAAVQIERVAVDVGERATRDVSLRNVQLLEGVTVTATAGRGFGDASGFARRREAGQGGVFLTEAQITARAATTTEQLLRGIIGLRFIRSMTGDVIAVVDRGPLTIKNFSCQGVGVFIDGSEAVQPFDVNQIPPTFIRAVEYYAGPAATPPELRSAKTVCGTLAIWMK